MRIALARLENLITIHGIEIGQTWDWLGRLDTKVARLHDLADPIELEATQRAAYRKLSDLQSKVEGVQLELAAMVDNSDIAAMQRLLNNIWDEIGLMKSQQEQTWALVQRAVIRP
jgi:hypothetical protein